MPETGAEVPGRAEARGTSAQPDVMFEGQMKYSLLVNSYLLQLALREKNQTEATRQRINDASRNLTHGLAILFGKDEVVTMLSQDTGNPIDYAMKEHLVSIREGEALSIPNRVSTADVPSGVSADRDSNNSVASFSMGSLDATATEDEHRKDGEDDSIEGNFTACSEQFDTSYVDSNLDPIDTFSDLSTDGVIVDLDDRPLGDGASNGESLSGDIETSGTLNMNASIITDGDDASVVSSSGSMASGMVSRASSLSNESDLGDRAPTPTPTAPRPAPESSSRQKQRAETSPISYDNRTAGIERSGDSSSTSMPNTDADSHSLPSNDDASCNAESVDDIDSAGEKLVANAESEVSINAILDHSNNSDTASSAYNPHATGDSPDSDAGANKSAETDASREEQVPEDVDSAAEDLVADAETEAPTEDVLVHGDNESTLTPDPEGDPPGDAGAVTNAETDVGGGDEQVQEDVDSAAEGFVMDAETAAAIAALRKGKVESPHALKLCMREFQRSGVLDLTRYSVTPEVLSLANETVVRLKSSSKYSVCTGPFIIATMERLRNCIYFGDLDTISDIVKDLNNLFPEEQNYLENKLVKHLHKANMAASQIKKTKEAIKKLVIRSDASKGDIYEKSKEATGEAVIEIVEQKNTDYEDSKKILEDMGKAVALDIGKAGKATQEDMKEVFKLGSAKHFISVLSSLDIGCGALRRIPLSSISPKGRAKVEHLARSKGIEIENNINSVAECFQVIIAPTLNSDKPIFGANALMDIMMEVKEMVEPFSAEASCSAFHENDKAHKANVKLDKRAVRNICTPLLALFLHKLYTSALGKIGVEVDILAVVLRSSLNYIEKLNILWADDLEGGYLLQQDISNIHYVCEKVGVLVDRSHRSNLYGKDKCGKVKEFKEKRVLLRNTKENIDLIKRVLMIPT